MRPCSRRRASRRASKARILRPPIRRRRARTKRGRATLPAGDAASPPSLARPEAQPLRIGRLSSCYLVERGPSPLVHGMTRAKRHWNRPASKKDRAHARAREVSPPSDHPWAHGSPSAACLRCLPLGLFRTCMQREAQSRRRDRRGRRFALQSRGRRCLLFERAPRRLSDERVPSRVHDVPHVALPV